MTIVNIEFQNGALWEVTQQNKEDIRNCLQYYISNIVNNNKLKNIKILNFVFVAEDCYQDYVIHHNNGHPPSEGGLAICLNNNQIAINLKKDILDNIFYNEKEHNFFFANLIAHEIAHIDLKNRFLLIDSNLNKVEAVNQLDRRRFLRETLRSFEEYYACDFAESNISDSVLHQYYKEHIIKTIYNIKQKKNEFQKVYYGDYIKYFDDSFLELNNFFILAGYYLGSKHITNSDKFLSCDFLDFNKLNDIFNQIKIEILNNNNKLSIFDNLVDIFEKTLCDFFSLSFDRDFGHIFVNLKQKYET